MAIAKLKLEQERAKVHAKKNALRIARGAVQPMLPLNSVNTDENEL